VICEIYDFRSLHSVAKSLQSVANPFSAIGWCNGTIGILKSCVVSRRGSQLTKLSDGVWLMAPN
jgi:hypothetical protein